MSLGRQMFYLFGMSFSDLAPIRLFNSQMILIFHKFHAEIVTRYRTDIHQAPGTGQLMASMPLKQNRMQQKSNGIKHGAILSKNCTQHIINTRMKNIALSAKLKAHSHTPHR